MTDPLVPIAVNRSNIFFGNGDKWIRGYKSYSNSQMNSIAQARSPTKTSMQYKNRNRIHGKIQRLHVYNAIALLHFDILHFNALPKNMYINSRKKIAQFKILSQSSVIWHSNNFTFFLFQDISSEHFSLMKYNFCVYFQK